MRMVAQLCPGVAFRRKQARTLIELIEKVRDYKKQNTNKVMLGVLLVMLRMPKATATARKNQPTPTSQPKRHNGPRVGFANYDINQPPPPKSPLSGLACHRLPRHSQCGRCKRLTRYQALHCHSPRFGGGLRPPLQPPASL